MFHLRIDPSIRADTTGDDNMSIVNDTFFTDPVHKGKGRGQKDLAFKPGKTRIVLNENLPTVRQDQRGALGDYFLAAKHYLMGRGIMLHFFAWSKVILT